MEILPVGVVAHPLDAPDLSSFVRRHEWTWRRRILELSEYASVGQEFDARVIGYDRTGLQLSRKQCLADPLLAFTRKHRVGERIRCRFQLLVKNGAGIRVEIGTGEDAVDGFVPRGHLPPASQDLDGFGLYVGDLLSARILGFDKDSVVLSIREQLRRRDAWIAASERHEPVTLQHSPKLGGVLERLYFQQRLAEAPAMSPSAQLREEIQRVLLIEDEEAVADSLQDALSHVGFEVTVIRQVSGVVELIEEAPFDLLILDRNLQGAEGTELLRDPRVTSGARFFCILSGTPSPVDLDQASELEGSGRILFLEKPTPPDVLFDQLSDLVSQGGSSMGKASQPPESVAAPAESEFSSWMPRQFGNPGHIEVILSELRNRCRSDYCFLLSYETGPVFHVLAGNFIELSREVQQRLEASPIGNIIRERGYEFENHLDDASAKRFATLREVVALAAFLGFGLAYCDQARYGVFLINEQPKPLQPLSEEERRHWELRITQHLMEARLATALVENQTLLLKGLLTGALLHEVGNRLQTLDDHSGLQVDVVKELEGPAPQLTELQYLDLLKSADGIHRASRNLDDLVRTFRNLFGTNVVDEQVRLGRLLEDLERTFRSVAHRDGLQVYLEIEDKLPLLRLNPKLLEQPILNLLLNATEQMVLRGSAVRKIWLDARTVRNENFPLQICIRDSGPGVHARDHDRIFDLFFTTKPKGTGLGLFIARLLVERFGGRLQLATSVLFEGSEFQIDLPVGVIA